MTEEFRTAPQNVDIEQQLIGAILQNNEAFHRVCDFLKPDHFMVEPHRRIYEVTSTLIRDGKVATPVTVKTFFDADETMAELSVTEYLTRLTMNATTIINAEDYGRTILDCAILRSLIVISEDIANAAYQASPDLTPRQLIETAERRLYEIAETGRYGEGFIAFSDAANAAVDMAAKAHDRGGGLAGLATGLGDLDRLMGGLQKSDLIIIAGRPAMGKTSIATNIAANIAQRDGAGTVGFFSLEMSAEQLATRVISEKARVSSSAIRRGSISHGQFDSLAEAARELQPARLFIDQTGGINVGQLAARARRLKRQRGLDLLVVDYLQLLSGSSKRGSSNRTAEITEITTGLKALAKELGAPIIALSQLSRQVENREDKRPQLSDLRESGSIEQDADVVLFVFREEYYLQGQTPEVGTAEFFEREAKQEALRGMAEVIVGKQRHGPTGTVLLGFDAQFTRFSDL